MRVSLDTNRLTDMIRGDSALAEFLAICEEIWIPLIVVGEIKVGFLGGNQLERNERELNVLLSKPNISVLFPDRDTAGHYARLRVQLKRAGTPIPTHDIWIAALALQHDLTLITRDRHFEKIPQLLCR